MATLTPTTSDWLRTCEFKWYASEVLGVEPRGLRRPARDRGSLLHSLLEHALRVYYSTDQVYAFEGDEGRRAARDIFVREAKRGVTCEEHEAVELLDAIRWHVPRLGLAQWEIVDIDDGAGSRVPLIEHRLYAPFGPHTLSAKVDLVMQHRVTGKVWLVDWKSTLKDLPERVFVLHDMQLLIQRIVLAQHDVKVDVSALCQLRSLAPQPPKLVHKGRQVSRNKAELSCTWEMYERAILDVGGDPADYEEMRPILEAKLFDRWLPDVTTPEAEGIMRHELAGWLDRAEQLTQRADPKRRLGYGCRSCDYQRWCEASMVDQQHTLVGIDYKLREDSPLRADPRNGKGDIYDPRSLYRAFGKRHGINIEGYEEFKP